MKKIKKLKKTQNIEQEGIFALIKAIKSDTSTHTIDLNKEMHFYQFTKNNFSFCYIHNPNIQKNVENSKEENKNEPKTENQTQIADNSKETSKIAEPKSESSSESKIENKAEPKTLVENKYTENISYSMSYELTFNRTENINNETVYIYKNPENTEYHFVEAKKSKAILNFDTNVKECEFK